MKRCPECLFIYPDSDARCDFDNTPLVVVDEAELEAVTSKPETPAKQKRATKKRTAKKRQRKTTVITAVIGLMLGVSAFTVYYRFTPPAQHTAQTQSTPIVSTPPIVAPITSPSPLPTEAPTSQATATASAKPERVATAHTTTTVAPVSTSGPGMGTKLGGKPIILLASGGKIDADEVWRTRDGVWYRRDGMVTLLKRGRVKAIVNQ
jgi:hypothetical protein